MKRVRMVLAYDGTNYCGWQLQPNGITIEEVLNQALSELLREPVAVIGASRTDSGVHAEGAVAVFDTENRMPADKICFALNQRLPEDIRVLESDEVPLDWHPRKQNCTKTYEYRILNRKISMPTRRLYSHFCYFDMDVEKMQQAAEYLIGEHDFKSFCTVRTQAEETVRTVYALSVTKDAEDMIHIRISGSGFLYNMVRIIAGTLMKVGMGVYPPESMEEILEARNRQAAGPTAPARGLTLISMEYEKELRPVITGENKHWSYRLIQKEVTEKKKAYLVIERCEDEFFDALLMRVTHQAVRNGARWVFVTDKEGQKHGVPRIVEGKDYGYYRFTFAHKMIWMKKEIKMETPLPESQKSPVKLVPVEQMELKKLEQMINRLFFDVPSSATISEEELQERFQKENERFFWIKADEQNVGFLMIIYHSDNLEIDSLGIDLEFRGKGLAGAALNQIERLASGIKISQLKLMVSTANQSAKTCYEKNGFKQEEISTSWFFTEGMIP